MNNTSGAFPINLENFIFIHVVPELPKAYWWGQGRIAGGFH